MKVRVSKKLRGELSIDAIGFPLKAGQIIELTQEQENSPNVLISISKGLLFDVKSVDKDIIVEEKPSKKEIKRKMKLTDLNKKAEQEAEVKEVKEIETVKEEETRTNMSAFDMEKQKLLDKEESTKTTMDRIGSVESEEIQVGKNIDFSDESLNETDEVKTDKIKIPKKKVAKKKTVKKTKKSTKKRTTAKKVQKQLKEAAKKISNSIKPVGNIKEEKTTDDLLVYDNSGDGDDIGFVDSEQEQERLDKRPELSKNNDLFD